MTAPHGTIARYRSKSIPCRCYACCLAMSRYNEQRAISITAGTWKPFADPAAAQRHVRALVAAGIGIHRIGELAGVDHAVVGDIHRGTRHRDGSTVTRIYTTTEAKLLAVRFDPAHITPRRLIDATGTHRRVQALVALGWPLAQLAAVCGHHPPTVRRWLRQDQVCAGTAVDVRALYNALAHTQPTAGAVSAQAAARACNLAAKNGWSPPTVWDDDTIDDPAAHPEWTGECGTQAGYRIHHRDGIPMCPPCREARAAQVRASRERVKAA